MGSPIGYFKWTDQGFYYLKDGTTTLYHYKNGAWTTINWGISGSCAGSWDRVNDELYIRTYGQHGFQVLDTNNDAIVRTITDGVGVGENSRTGSLSGGFFYTREWNQSLKRYDAITGVKTDTARRRSPATRPATPT